MAVIGINYTGCNHEYNDENERIEITNPEKRLKYESVYIHCNDKKHDRVFDSGNFVKDWFDVKKYYMEELLDVEPYLSGSSSCNDFFMDGASYDSAYLHIESDETPLLKYLDRSDPKWYLSRVCDGWEFFVEEGTTPTWEELKAMCKTNNSI